MRRVNGGLTAFTPVLLVGFAIGLALSVPAGAQAQSDAVAYDGTWWLAQSRAEKFGFYSGVGDCYGTDVMHGVYHENDRDTEGGIDDFDRFYRSGKYTKTRQVLDVIRIEDGVGPIKWASPDHGAYDGLWWTMWRDDELDDARDGFVRAYLACQAKYLHRRAAKPTAFYVQKITEWYHLDANGAASTKRISWNIGNEIVRLLKHPD